MHAAVVWIYLVLCAIMLPLPPLMTWPLVAFAAMCKWQIILNTASWEMPYTGCCALEDTPIWSKEPSLSVVAPLLVTLLMSFAGFIFRRQSFHMMVLVKQASKARIEQLSGEKQRLDFERAILESRLKGSLVRTSLSE
jgi:hypothetical protein